MYTSTTYVINMIGRSNIDTTSITSEVVKQLIWQADAVIENYTGQTFETSYMRGTYYSSVDSLVRTISTELAAGFLATRLSVDSTRRVTIGDLSIDKTTDMSQMASDLKKSAMEHLKLLGKNLSYNFTNI